MPRRRTLFVPCVMLILVAGGAGGCDRQQAAPPVATTRATPVKFDVDLKPLTSLLPNRATHLSVDPRGNLYWVQETDRGDDTLFVIGEGDIPRATQLSAGNIGAAMGAGADARGNIQGIAAAPGGEIYFYFRGTAGRQALSALGVFQPKTAAIRILADSAALEDATGMGKSLTLATGSVLSDGRTVWVWVRHTDAWCVFRLDPRALPPAGPVKPTRAFDAVLLGGESIPLTRDEYDLAPAPDSGLFLVDTVGGRLLKIAPDGKATVALSLLGLPSVLSPPVVDRSGRLLLFAAHATPIAPASPAALDGSAKTWTLDVPWPALLIFAAGDDVTTIGRDNIRAYPGFPVFGLKMQELVPGGPGEKESWIGYDANSGEVLRATLRQRVWP